MIRKQPKEWQDSLVTGLESLESQPPLRFSQMIPGDLPEKAGVYLITKIEGNTEIPYYVGRTKNIRKRLYDNHFKGSGRAAPLKKYLKDNEICSTIEEANDFLRENCAARWLKEDKFRVRLAVEGYWTAILFPEYMIDKEH